MAETDTVPAMTVLEACAAFTLGWRTLEDAGRDYHWHQSKVRVSRPAKLPLSECVKLLALAVECGLPDMRDQATYSDFFTRSSDAQRG